MVVIGRSLFLGFFIKAEMYIYVYMYACIYMYVCIQSEFMLIFVI